MFLASFLNIQTNYYLKSCRYLHFFCALKHLLICGQSAILIHDVDKSSTGYFVDGYSVFKLSHVFNAVLR